MLLKASRYTKAWCALPVQSQCLLKSENLTTFDDGSLTSVEERVMGSNNSVWAEDLSLLRFVVSLCTNILQWSVIGSLKDLEESWQRTLDPDHHTLNMSHYNVTSASLFWNCESNVFSWICKRRIVEDMCAVTSLKPLPSAADEQNHGVLHRVEMIISNWSWLCKQDGDAGGGDDVDVGDDRNHEGQCSNVA